MNIEFKCPQCGQLVTVDEVFRGQVVQCPKCEKGIVVPRGRTVSGSPRTLGVGVTERYITKDSNVSTSAAPTSGSKPSRNPLLHVRKPEIPLGEKKTTGNSQTAFWGNADADGTGTPPPSRSSGEGTSEHDDSRYVKSQVVNVKPYPWEWWRNRIRLVVIAILVVSTCFVLDSGVVRSTAAWAGRSILALFSGSIAMCAECYARWQLGSGIASFNNGEYVKALRIFRPLAEGGYAPAESYMGRCYHAGFGVDKNKDESMQWWYRAAEQDDPYGQFGMGICFEGGMTLDKSETPAVQMCRKAADQGLADAQFGLGLCYFEGIGVSRFYGEAIKLFRLAAEQGHVEAQYQFARCLSDGHIMEECATDAVAWFRKSAEQGYVKAQYRLALCLMDGYGTNKDEKEAVQWFRKAAEQGFAEAQYRLALCLMDGIGLAADEEGAVEWFRKAAEQGHAESQYRLALCLMEGIGTAVNMREAVQWLRKAAEQGHVEAQFQLGECYRLGRGAEENEEQAEKWYRKAAAQDHEGAKAALKKIEEDRAARRAREEAARRARLEREEAERKRAAEEALRRELARRMKCPACLGDREVTCDGCKGKGTVTVPFGICGKCGGKRYLKSYNSAICGKCMGNGNIEDRHVCSGCNGKKGFRCKTCGGKGILNRTMELRYPQCPDCNGKKMILCMMCNGKGYETVDTKECEACFGTGKYQVKCMVCRGTGQGTREEECPKCEGRKKVGCDRCHGKGWVYKDETPVDSATNTEDDVQPERQGTDTGKTVVIENQPLDKQHVEREGEQKNDTDFKGKDDPPEKRRGRRRR